MKQNDEKQLNPGATVAPPVYTSRDLASRWKVPPVAVRRAISDGALRAKKVGSEFLITAEAEREFLAEHDLDATAPAFEEGERVVFYADGELREGRVLGLDDESGKLRVEVPGFFGSHEVELDESSAQVLTLDRPSN